MRARADWHADDPDEQCELLKGKLYWQLSEADATGWVRAAPADNPAKEGIAPKVINGRGFLEGPNLCTYQSRALSTGRGV